MEWKGPVDMAFKATARGDLIDWQAIRETINLTDVATRLLGPAPGRRGEGGRRHWWRCPFHEDHNPSFCIKPGGRQWRCWGCGSKGDVIELVRRLNPGWTFPEAVAYLAGKPAPAGKPSRPRLPAASPAEAAERPPEQPSGLSLADALALTADAEQALWTPKGTTALAYLRGRGMSADTIRAARLGWTPEIMLPTTDGARYWRATGIVIPWRDGERLALVKIRQPEEKRPKYAEAFRDRPRIYPGPEAIRPGKPLVVVEGEFDALLLGQELGELAGVLTLGSASIRPEGSTYLAMLSAPVWYAAHDADEAGDKAAAEWPAPAIRVRPPEGKDWTDARQAGVALRRWFIEDVLPLDGPFADEERAAIYEFDAGLTREAAERLAGASPVREGQGHADASHAAQGTIEPRRYSRGPRPDPEGDSPKRRN
jgi:DNA primase